MDNLSNFFNLPTELCEKINGYVAQLDRCDHRAKFEDVICELLTRQSMINSYTSPKNSLSNWQFERLPRNLNTEIKRFARHLRKNSATLKSAQRDLRKIAEITANPDRCWRVRQLVDIELRQQNRLTQQETQRELFAHSNRKRPARIAAKIK
jgi:hypothetical protein